MRALEDHPEMKGKWRRTSNDVVLWAAAIDWAVRKGIQDACNDKGSRAFARREAQEYEEKQKSHRYFRKRRRLAENDDSNEPRIGKCILRASSTC